MVKRLQNVPELAFLALGEHETENDFGISAVKRIHHFVKGTRHIVQIEAGYWPNAVSALAGLDGDEDD